MKQIPIVELQRLKLILFCMEQIFNSFTLNHVAHLANLVAHQCAAVHSLGNADIHINTQITELY